jgi:hypothetical protein
MRAEVFVLAFLLVASSISVWCAVETYRLYESQVPQNCTLSYVRHIGDYYVFHYQVSVCGHIYSLTEELSTNVSSAICWTSEQFCQASLIHSMATYIIFSFFAIITVVAGLISLGCSLFTRKSTNAPVLVL